MDFLKKLVSDLNFCYILYKSVDRNQKLYFEMIINNHKIKKIFDDDIKSNNFFTMEYNGHNKNHTIMYKIRHEYINISETDITFLNKEFMKTKTYVFTKFAYLNN